MLIVELIWSQLIWHLRVILLKKKIYMNASELQSLNTSSLYRMYLSFLIHNITWNAENKLRSQLFNHSLTLCTNNKQYNLSLTEWVRIEILRWILFRPKSGAETGNWQWVLLNKCFHFILHLFSLSLPSFHASSVLCFHSIKK